LTSRAVLPKEFSDLTDLVEEWALETPQALNSKRLNSTIEQLDSLYSRLDQRMVSIMCYLQKFSVSEETSDADDSLYRLARAFMEIAPAVELFRDPDIPDGFPSEKFKIVL